MSCITQLLKSGAVRANNNPGSAIVEGGGVYRNYEYLVVFNPIGFRCGYVAINKSHPLNSSAKSHDDIEDMDIDMHGGCTYFGRQMTSYDCDDVWIGFDCAHAGDLWDVDSLREKKAILHEDEYFAIDTALRFASNAPHVQNLRGEWPTVKNFNYVENECKGIINQLHQQFPDTNNENICAC